MDRKSIIKRMERIRNALEQRGGGGATLVYADGSRRSMGLLEAVDELCGREDVVDVLAENETTSSLLRGMIGPWDFSDLPEVE